MKRTRPVLLSEALDDLVCFDLYVASRAVTRRYRPMLDRHDLTYPQYLAIVHLGAEGASSVKDVAGAMRLDHATVTPLLQRMEARGLLDRTRDPADGRSSLVDLTDAGREILADAENIKCTVTADLGLTPDEIRVLQGSLRRIEASMNEALESLDD